MTLETFRLHFQQQIDGHENLRAQSAQNEVALAQQLEQARANTNFLAGKVTMAREALAALNAEAQPKSGGGTS
jgi:hypothetical protein